MSDKIFRLFAWLAIAGAGVIIFTLAYWEFYPYKTIEFEQPFRVLNENKQVKRGEELRYWLKFTKWTELPADTTRDIFCTDGNRVTLTTNPSNVPPGSKEREVGLTIPEKTSLGECVYRSTITYQVNPVRTIIIRLESEPFYVVE